MQRAEKFLEARPEVVNVISNVSPGSGEPVRDDGATRRSARPTQAQFSAILRKEFSSYPGLRASVQDLSQQGFGGTKGYPVEFSVRGSDWTTLVALAMKMKAEAAASGLVTRRRQRLPARRAGARRDARSRPRHGRGCLRQRRRERRERARRGRRRRPVLVRRAPDGHTRSPRRSLSDRAPRISPSCACVCRTARWSRSRRW